MGAPKVKVRVGLNKDGLCVAPLALLLVSAWIPNIQLLYATHQALLDVTGKFHAAPTLLGEIKEGTHHSG